MNSPIKNVNISIDGNAQSAELLSNELASLAAAGKCYRIKYSVDLGRMAAIAITKESRLVFLTTDKDGKPTNAPRAFASAFPREARQTAI